VSERRDDGHGEGHDPREEVGSLADEAVRLFGALSDWARDATEEIDEHVAAECTWCPLCRTVHAVRAAGPEVRSHLAVAASALLQAAAGVLAAAAPAPGSPGSPAQGGMGFEHIDLDGDPDGEHDGAWPEEDDE
jgi:hypothetical protein